MHALSKQLIVLPYQLRKQCAICRCLCMKSCRGKTFELRNRLNNWKWNCMIRCLTGWREAAQWRKIHPHDYWSFLLPAHCLFVSSWIPELVLFLSSLPTAWQIQYCWKLGTCGLFQTEKKGEFKYRFRRDDFALDSFMQKEDVFAGSERKGKLLKAVWILLEFFIR